ncbi:hypothetical protein CO657_30720 (plasmid) [Rhizobium acidisoli]|uniref:DUF6894 domain-containing protein n=1 Tax=Rhizobium acidisoli TaxID=1538158 RepID=A0AAE5WTC2_9HYPH|nr:hypothetical protein [Rhizobium acidisoli]KPH06181.1 hypothetical protein AOG23_23355 [Rhizobium acidisoli]QAS82211.1 hypothetical protein CO657_30720 [Rhizobium acidisoli]
MSTAARYIFHLITPVGAVNDVAKADFASLDDARAEAMTLAKEYMRRAAGDGRDVSGYAIEIFVRPAEPFLS